MHALAFEGLTLSLIQNGKRDINLQIDIQHLSGDRRKQIDSIRAKHFIGKSKKRSVVRSTHEEHALHAQEMKSELRNVLSALDDIRGRFAQQIEDSMFSGYEELATHYAARLLFLETKGAEVLENLHQEQEDAVEIRHLITLINGISAVQDAVRKQLEWIPDLQHLIVKNSSQYSTILQPSY